MSGKQDKSKQTEAEDNGPKVDIVTSDTYKPTEHDGLKKDGEPDGRVDTGEFAHGKVDPHEAGKKGGSSS